MKWDKVDFEAALRLFQICGEVEKNTRAAA